MYALNVIRDIMVPMRDGVRLATDVYLPDGAVLSQNINKWPVLLERTPYNKEGLNKSEQSLAFPAPMPRPEIAHWFSSNGYVVIIQDCRGRYRSEGRFTKYLHEAEDGSDTIAWIMEQSWCNGKIGTFGVSYGAHTQIAAACLNPPGLAAMFLDSGGFASAYHGGIRRGGAFEMKQVTWALKHALLSPETENDPARKAALQSVNLVDWFGTFPWSPGNSPLSAAPEFEDYLFEQWQNGSYGDYWQRLGLSALGYYADMPDIPVMILNSWYDPYVGTSLTNFEALSQNRNSPVFLTMGPWTHGQRSVSYAGDVDFGKSAVFEHHFGMDYLEYRRDWFDFTLKGMSSSSFDAEQPVTLFVMGGGTGHPNGSNRLAHGGAWQVFDQWPVGGAVATSFYLDVEGKLTRQPPKLQESFRAYVYDPKQPTPTIGGAITSGEPIMVGGAFDQRESDKIHGCTSLGRAMKDRPDVLSFETRPLETDTRVVGPIVARLWVASDQLDTDFVVKLIDVHPESCDFPEGFAMNLTDGILRARYRGSWVTPTLMEPGEIYEIEVELFATANMFRKGHRIRVDISSCSFPQFDPNPNTGEPEGAWTTTAVATNKIYMDVNRPSHIVLPIMALKDSQSLLDFNQGDGNFVSGAQQDDAAT